MDIAEWSEEQVTKLLPIRVCAEAESKLYDVRHGSICLQFLHSGGGDRRIADLLGHIVGSYFKIINTGLGIWLKYFPNMHKNLGSSPNLNKWVLVVQVGHLSTQEVEAGHQGFKVISSYKDN